MTSVSAQNLVVTRSAYPAIANSSFDLPKHHCTIVTGSNGSGKTTLLKAIAGIAEIERGTLTLDDGGQSVDYSDSRALRRTAAYIGHTPLFMRHISLIEHLQLCIAIDSNLKKTSDEQPKFVLTPEKAMEVFALAPRKNVRVEDLSAGQQRRLHLASAFVRSTPLLCIDEPHSSLDEDSKKAIDEVLSEQFKNGRSLIIATHDPQRIEPFATHHITIKNGVSSVSSIAKVEESN